MKTASNSRVLRTITLMIIAMLLSPFAYGKVIYVDDDATWANNGMGWATAYLCLQDAVAAALSGDEIRVAKGVYKPDQHFIKGRFTGVQASGDRTATFQLINRVTIKGGYAGHGEPDPDARDVDLYETILSGDLNGNDGPGFTNNAENSYHVLTGSETDQTGVLDGFIITAGNANANNSIPYDRGGGMYNGQSSPTLNNCKFNGNFSDSGGAMYNWQSRPTLTNCTFSSNRADKGGGAINNWQSSPAFTNCTFSNNSAGSGGGAINNVTESNSTMINCTLTGNSAGWDGGGIGNVSSSPTFTNCIFYENLSERDGGGMSNSDGSHPIVTNCTFSGNLAYRHGGGMDNEQSSPTSINCVFSGNSANSNGGGMRNRYDSHPDLINCNLTGNSAAKSGGGIRNYNSSPTLTNCIFSENSAEQWAVGISNADSSNPVLRNCIMWGNTAQHIPLIHQDNTSLVTITYSDVQGGWPGEGNINADPYFASPGYRVAGNPRTDSHDLWIAGDYHLKSEAGRWNPNSQSWVQDDVTSPCIDAGDPNSPIALEPFPNGGIINMGAYGGTAEASKSIYGLHTKYSGGTGRQNDPYGIATVASTSPSFYLYP